MSELVVVVCQDAGTGAGANQLCANAEEMIINAANLHKELLLLRARLKQVSTGSEAGLNRV